MHIEELKHLVSEYGEEKTSKAIVTLGLYKKSTGKKYVSDYNAILNWVINRVERDEKNQSSSVQKSNGIRFKGYSKEQYDDLENYYDI